MQFALSLCFDFESTAQARQDLQVRKKSVWRKDTFKSSSTNSGLHLLHYSV